MNTIMNIAGMQGLGACYQPNVGYFIKLLHDGRMDDQGTHANTRNSSNNSEMEPEGLEKSIWVIHTKVYGFMVIKILPDNRMSDTLEDVIMDSANTDLIQQLRVHENGKFGADNIIQTIV